MPNKANVKRWIPATRYPTARALLDHWEWPEHDVRRMRAYTQTLRVSQHLGTEIL